MSYPSYALVCEPLLRECKFSQLMSHHVLGDKHRQILLAIVNLEFHSATQVSHFHEKEYFNVPNKVRQDGARPSLSLNGSMVCQSLAEVVERYEVWACYWVS